MAAELFPDLEIRLAPNGVAIPSLLLKKQARQGLGVTGTASLAVFAAHGGEAAAYKSGDHWLELWREIKSLAPAALGMFIGGREGSREGDLFRWPYLPPERLSRFLAAADVLVYPTLADNHSLVVLEAMAAATAVVAFGVGGIPEQIRSGETGLLVDPGNWKSLAKAAAGLLANPRLAASMGLKSRAFVEGDFTTECMIQRHLEIYESISSTN